MKTTALNGKRMRSIKATHAYIKRMLSFPSYYGKNLNALYDCLTDSCFGKSVIIVNADIMRENLGDYADSLLEVFNAADGKCGFRFLGCIDDEGNKI